MVVLRRHCQSNFIASNNRSCANGRAQVEEKKEKTRVSRQVHERECGKASIRILRKKERKGKGMRRMKTAVPKRV